MGTRRSERFGWLRGWRRGIRPERPPGWESGAGVGPPEFRRLADGAGGRCGPAGRRSSGSYRGGVSMTGLRSETPDRSEKDGTAVASRRRSHRVVRTALPTSVPARRAGYNPVPSILARRRPERQGLAVPIGGPSVARGTQRGAASRSLPVGGGGAEVVEGVAADPRHVEYDAGGVHGSIGVADHTNPAMVRCLPDHEGRTGDSGIGGRISPQPGRRQGQSRRQIPSRGR